MATVNFIIYYVCTTLRCLAARMGFSFKWGMKEINIICHQEKPPLKNQIAPTMSLYTYVKGKERGSAFRCPTGCVLIEKRNSGATKNNMK